MAGATRTAVDGWCRIGYLFTMCVWMAGATRTAVDGWCLIGYLFTMCVWMAGATRTAVDGWCHIVAWLLADNCYIIGKEKVRVGHPASHCRSYLAT